MNYKKLTIYALIINILMNLIFFIDNTFLTDSVGYYIYFLILLFIYLFNNFLNIINCHNSATFVVYN